MSKKNKEERRAHRKQKENGQKVPRRTPNLARVGEALSRAILDTPYYNPSPAALELIDSHPEFTREQIILATSCYYYAGAGSLLLTARALDTNLPAGYSLQAGKLTTRAKNEDGLSFDLSVGFLDHDDPERINRGDAHAWIQLIDGGTHHLIDLTARSWWCYAAKQKLTPAKYPNFVDFVNPVGAPVQFVASSTFFHQENRWITQHMNARLQRDGEGVDHQVIDIALRAASILDWETIRLRALPVRQAEV